MVINIPLTTLTTGQDLSSPTENIGSFVNFSFSINRNVGVTPLNGLTGDCIEMHVEYSNDGGTTFPLSDNQTIAGGIITNKGTQVNASTWGSTFPNGFTQVRARVHCVQGCTVSGSFTLT